MPGRGGKRPGRVAAGVSQRGGEVGVAGRRNAPTARLRRLAVTRRRLPLRAWEASSLKVTSRTQCSRFSILQCPRSQPASCAGLAAPRARLVTAYMVTAYTVTLRPRRPSGARMRQMA
jgi:hypothetical protein